MAEDITQSTVAETNPDPVVPIAETVSTEQEIVKPEDLPIAPVPEPKIVEPEAVESTAAEVTPKIDPEPIPAETPVKSTPTVSEPEIITVRTQETGDKVYAVRNQKRYWVKNPETLAKMGFYLGKEKNIPFSELLGYPEGEPVDLTIPDAVYPWDKPEPPQSTGPTNSSAIWQ